MPYETERLSTILATHENDTFIQPVYNAPSKFILNLAFSRQTAVSLFQMHPFSDFSPLCIKSSGMKKPKMFKTEFGFPYIHQPCKIGFWVSTQIFSTYGKLES